MGLAELGVVAAGSREDIPSENLFRTGAAQSLRGYRYQSLGVPEAGAITSGATWCWAASSISTQSPRWSRLRCSMTSATPPTRLPVFPRMQAMVPVSAGRRRSGR